MMTMNIYLRMAIVVCSLIFLSCNSNHQKEHVENNGQVEIKKFSGSENKSDPKNEFQDEDSESETEARNTYKILSPEKVKDHIGEIVTVKGIISYVHVSEKVAYLNFGKKFPKNDFSGVVFSGKFSEFDDLDSFKDKLVEITGNVSVFRNKPQIILNSSDQIKILK